MLQLHMRTWRIRPTSISTALVNSTMHCEYLNHVLGALIKIFYIILNHNCICVRWVNWQCKCFVHSYSCTVNHKEHISRRWLMDRWLLWAGSFIESLKNSCYPFESFWMNPSLNEQNLSECILHLNNLFDHNSFIHVRFEMKLELFWVSDRYQPYHY